MVTDQTSHMKQLQHSVLIGAIYTLPLLVWSLLQLSAASNHDEASYILQSGISIAVIAQAIVLSLYIPRMFDKTPTGSSIFTLLILISVPWPLFTLAWLANAIGIAAICISQIGIIFFALLLLIITRVLFRFTLQSDNKTLALSGLQLTAISLVIIFPYEWMAG